MDWDAGKGDSITLNVQEKLWVETSATLSNHSRAAFGGMSLAEKSVAAKVAASRSHSGVFETREDQVTSWSCCGAELQGAQGCIVKIKDSRGSWEYGSI